MLVIVLEVVVMCVVVVERVGIVVMGEDVVLIMIFGIMAVVGVAVVVVWVRIVDVGVVKAMVV
jgi:hypothetical protein